MGCKIIVFSIEALTNSESLPNPFTLLPVYPFTYLPCPSVSDRPTRMPSRNSAMRPSSLPFANPAQAPPVAQLTVDN